MSYELAFHAFLKLHGTLSIAYVIASLFQLILVSMAMVIMVMRRWTGLCRHILWCIHIITLLCCRFLLYMSTEGIVLRISEGTKIWIWSPRLLLLWKRRECRLYIYMFQLVSTGDIIGIVQVIYLLVFRSIDTRSHLTNLVVFKWDLYIHTTHGFFGGWK